MKRVVIAGIAILAVSAAVLVACEKEAAAVSAAKKPSASTEKTTRTRRILPDADLIRMIRGQVPEYVNLSDLEDLLYENAALSNDVMRALIAEDRVPDFIVETALVLSAPLTDAQLAYLQAERPGLSTTAIVEAAAADADANYVIVNCNPRQVLFGKGMVKSSNCESCGEGTIATQSDNLLVDLTSTTGDLDPAAVKPCNSSNTEWVCGTAKRVYLQGTDGTTATYSVTCEQSTKKCIQNVQDARK